MTVIYILPGKRHNSSGLADNLPRRPVRPFFHNPSLLRHACRIVCMAGYALILLGSAAGPAGAVPRLTEFLADNKETVQDEDGDASDYIEIYNPDSEPYSLAGYTLTDDPADRQRWQFPPVLLQPGEHRLIWASGKNRSDPKRPLHTNFRMERDGGYLALFPPRGSAPVTVFAAYPPQVTDRSYGLYLPETVLTPVAAGAACRWTVPGGPIPGWQNPGFSDLTWNAGRTGIGFDLATSGVTYTPLLGPGGNTVAAMYERNATAYLRIAFNLTDRKALSALNLRLKSDDGCIVWLNGARVASRFAPDTPSWNSAATALTDDEDALAFESIGIPAGLGSLKDGENVLAIQALNGSPDNQDFLMVPELELRVYETAAALSEGFFLSPTPGGPNTPADGGFTADTKFSVDRGIYSAPFSLTISCETPASTIYYTTDSSTPDPGTARIYTGPIPVSRTTVVRAMADAEGRHPSNVDTQTYVFPSDVIRQTAPAGYPATWGSEVDEFGGETPVLADYAMDQSVVNDPQYAGLAELGLRDALPVVSLSTDGGLFFDPDGIYSNGRYGSGEIPVSMELLGPGLTGDFQIDAGVRIHGGNARSHPKKPFRLYFRKSYGTDRLRYPLFPESPVQRFDQLILRPGGHDGWAVPFGNQSTLLASHATYVRDQYLRLTETAMGRLSPRGRYVHLYLNGLYWGLYDLHERANADYYSSHLGGSEEDWDVVHHPTFVGENYSQVDGTGGAWDEVLQLADTGVRNDSDYQNMAGLLDVDDYIDHLIVRIWSGDYDWCAPIYLKNGSEEADAGYFDNKNWYTARRSRGIPGKFLFHVWDAEMSMGTHLMLNRGSNFQPPWLPYFPPQRIAGFDSTRVGTPGSLAWPYAALRAYPPFRQKFGDHLQKHFFGKGLMSTSANIARLDSLTQQLDLPLVAESARWGDVNRFNPLNLALTRDLHWKPEVRWLRDTFMAGRNALVLDQFRATGLFPGTPAPLAVPEAGTVPTGTPLILTAAAQAGTEIYYTLDGSDPSVFMPVQRRPLVEEGADCQWWVPTSSIGATWSTLAGPSNAVVWRNGRNGLGYDQETPFLPHFLTDVNAAMRGFRTSVYFRMEFTLDNQSAIDDLSEMVLEVKYDDGFIAAINGTVVQRANAPAVESFSSAATALHDDSSAVVFVPFALNPATVRPLLRVGRNVLAIQGLNQTVNSSDFLCTVRLTAQTGGTLSAAPAALLYDRSQPPVLSGSVTVKARAVQAGEWSALTEPTYLTGVRASRENLVPSQIHYRPAPPDAAELAAGFDDDGAFEFIELINPSAWTVDLSGCRFTNGIQFSFDNASVTQLLPGERLIIARNPAALGFRHNTRLRIAGAFEAGTALSNGGERLRLEAADGHSIFDLAYQDSTPWPLEADGGGPSLVLVNPLGLTDPANPLHWRASLTPLGSPGQSDSPGFAAWIGSAPPTGSGPLDDPDHDGWTNLLEYATGSHAFDAGSTPVLILAPSADGPILTYQINPEASSVALNIEEAGSPEGPWQPARGLTEAGEMAEPGLRHYQTGATHPAARRFFRLRATLP